MAAEVLTKYGLPPGTRFVPTGLEALHLLGLRLRGRPLPWPLGDIFHETRILGHHPQELYEQYKEYEETGYIYFFSDLEFPRTAAAAADNGERRRPVRAARGGGWKPSGRVKELKRPRKKGGGLAGRMVTMVFYERHLVAGARAKMVKTDWGMHEFTVPIGPDQFSKVALYRLYKLKNSKGGSARPEANNNNVPIALAVADHHHDVASTSEAAGYASGSYATGQASSSTSQEQKQQLIIQQYYHEVPTTSSSAAAGYALGSSTTGTGLIIGDGQSQHYHDGPSTSPAATDVTPSPSYAYGSFPTGQASTSHQEQQKPLISVGQIQHYHEQYASAMPGQSTWAPPPISQQGDTNKLVPNAGSAPGYVQFMPSSEPEAAPPAAVNQEEQIPPATASGVTHSPPPATAAASQVGEQCAPATPPPIAQIAGSDETMMTNKDQDSSLFGDLMLNDDIIFDSFDDRFVCDISELLSIEEITATDNPFSGDGNNNQAETPAPLNYVLIY